MSTDWIKMRVDLRTHPKVVRMAGALKADKLRVIGGLFAVWAIFDAHSEDGVLEGYSLRSIDEELNWKGFAQAMQGIGWLVCNPDHTDGLLAPRFEEHNGQSAKRRAMETERKRLEREAEKAAAEAAKTATQSGHLSASNADKSVTREEKRREEKEIPPKAPTGADARFEKFWESYPKRVGKDAARKAFEKRKPDDSLLAQMLAAIAVQKASPAWTKDGGQFIPNPSTWLTQGRWQDETATAGSGTDPALAQLFARGAA